MSIFLERFVIPILATGVVGLIILNPLKWDTRQRISLLISTVALAYFVGHTLSLNESAPTQGAPSATEAPKKSGDAITSGPNSPAVSGDGNSVTYGQPEADKKKKEMKKAKE